MMSRTPAAAHGALSISRSGRQSFLNAAEQGMAVASMIFAGASIAGAGIAGAGIAGAGTSQNTT